MTYFYKSQEIAITKMRTYLPECLEVVTVYDFNLFLKK